MFIVTEQLPQRYPEDQIDLKFVKEFKEGDVPRINEALVIDGNSFRVKDVERNYDTNTVYVYVNRKIDYNDFD
jgi:hypothetical protein